MLYHICIYNAGADVNSGRRYACRLIDEAIMHPRYSRLVVSRSLSYSIVEAPSRRGEREREKTKRATEERDAHSHTRARAHERYNR